MHVVRLIAVDLPNHTSNWASWMGWLHEESKMNLAIYGGKSIVCWRDCGNVIRNKIRHESSWEMRESSRGQVALPCKRQNKTDRHVRQRIEKVNRKMSRELEDPLLLPIRCRPWLISLVCREITNPLHCRADGLELLRSRTTVAKYRSYRTLNRQAIPRYRYGPI